MFRNYQRKSSFVKKCYFIQSEVFHLKHLGFNQVLANSRQSSKRTLPGFLQSLPGLRTLETATTGQIKTKLKRNCQWTWIPSFRPALLMRYFLLLFKKENFISSSYSSGGCVFYRIDDYLQEGLHKLFKIRRIWIKMHIALPLYSLQKLKQISLQLTF